MAQFPMEFELPSAMLQLCAAQEAVRQHYEWTGLKFTLDGRLIGDLAEAVALEHYDIEPCQFRTKGVDAITSRTRATVQVKSSASGRGPTFGPGDGTAAFLIFVRLDFGTGKAVVEYNGPEAPIRALLPKTLKTSTQVRLDLLHARSRRVESCDEVPLRPSRVRADLDI